MSDKIISSYKASKDIYDDVLTQSSMFGKLYIKLFWQGVDDNRIAAELLFFYPEKWYEEFEKCVEMQQKD